MKCGYYYGGEALGKLPQMQPPSAACRLEAEMPLLRRKYRALRSAGAADGGCGYRRSSKLSFSKEARQAQGVLCRLQARDSANFHQPFADSPALFADSQGEFLRSHAGAERQPQRDRRLQALRRA